MQLRVANGLHPMPSRPPVTATVHAESDRGDYSVEAVYFESSPGLFVTGSLYRPKGDSLPANAAPGLPVVLCPYGHWEDGRFYDQGEDGVAEQLRLGAEDFEQGGRCPLQARCVGLARLGCVAFMYDMLGRADGTASLSDYIAHGFNERRPEMETAERWGLYSARAEGRLISMMGLFTWNSIRALDWICALPGVDTERIGCTGASGGGTQTFVLAALDERISAAFPCVMVGCAMQGGCTCENCCLLRIGTGNVEIAATIAPRPLGMTGANDWTVDIEREGLPSLQRIYRMLGAPSNAIEAKFLDFEHNYNARSRAQMYSFFNEHLELGHDVAALTERDFVPMTPAELTVWSGDAEADRPTPNGDGELRIVRAIAADASAQWAGLSPADQRRHAREAYRVMLAASSLGSPSPKPASLLGGGKLPASLQELLRSPPFEIQVETESGAMSIAVHAAKADAPGSHLFRHRLSAEPAVVVLVSDREHAEEVASLTTAGFTVLVPSLLLSGSGTEAGLRLENDRGTAIFTHCYNASLFARRVADVVAAVGAAAQLSFDLGGLQRCHLICLDPSTAAVTAAACHLANDSAPTNDASADELTHDPYVATHGGSPVVSLALSTGGFRFADISSIIDSNFLPGAVKYGDLPMLIALTAPTPLWLAGEPNLNSHRTATMQRGKVFLGPPHRVGGDGRGFASVLRQFHGEPRSAAMRNDVTAWLTGSAAGVLAAASL
jgi:dienelactone hydrolase